MSYIRFQRVALISSVCAIALAGCHSSDNLGSTAGSQPVPPQGSSPSAHEVSHPGSAPWQQVPRDRVAAECGLDPDLLDAAEAAGLGNSPHAIIRYGKLCWTGGDPAAGSETLNVNSASKTFGAMLFGIVAAHTDVDENSRAHDWFTYGELWADPIGAVQALPPLNPNAKIFHVLTQTGHNPLLGYGLRVPWSYDAVGLRGMNALVPIMDKVIKTYPEAFPGSTGVKDMAVKELFEPLGMTSSQWPGIVIAHTLESNVQDMARLGLLLLRKGRWGDRQIIDEDYVYRLSHPQIEDIHTGYGYLTWLNAADGVAALFDFKVDLECSPFSGWQTYPHAPTYEAPNSNGGAPYQSTYDVGVFWADGAGGQMTYIHRGLDLVMVIRDDEAAQENDAESQERGSSNPTGLEFHRMWRYVRPALVAMDPVYKGDEAAFCEAYRRGDYAPDLISPWNAGSGFGSVHLSDP